MGVIDGGKQLGAKDDVGVTWRKQPLRTIAYKP